MSTRQSTNPTRDPQSFGLALTGGAGVILMIIALGVGVVDTTASGSAIAVTFAAGLALLAAGVIGWIAITKPFNHFDDINVPKYTGHHDEHDAAHEEAHAEPTELAIIPHD